MGYSDSGTITLKLLATDLASGNLAKFGANLDTLAKRGGLAGSVLQGVGQSFGQMLNPLHFVEEGIHKVADVIGDSVTAANEDQAATVRLMQSIRDNTAAHGDYQDAIEKADAAGVNLGFTETAQKDALVLLVAQTKDMTAALDANHVAMDLARFKNVDLSTAAALVGKAYTGNLTALKKMGIELPKGTKGMAALSAITKVAGGQASAFTQTMTGRMDVMAAEVDTVQVKFGGLVTTIEGALLDSLGHAADGFNSLGDFVSHIIDPAGARLNDVADALQMIGELQGVPQSTIDSIIATQKATKDAASASQAEIDQVASGVDALRTAGTSMEDFARQEAQAGFTREAVWKGIAAALQGQMSDADAYNTMVEAMKAYDAEGAQLHATAVQQASDTRDTTDAQWRANSVMGQAFTLMDQQRAAEAKVAASKAFVNHFKTLYATVDALPPVVKAAVSAVAVDLSSLTGITRTSLKDAAKEAKTGMADVIWALKHPMADAKLDKEYHKELTKAEHALKKAFDEGNPIAIAKAEALVRGIEAKIAELESAQISMSVALSYHNQQRSGAGTNFHGQPPPAWGNRTSSTGSGGQGFGAGGGDLHVHFHGVVAAPGPAEAQRLGNIIGPAVARHLQSSGHL